LRTLIQQIELRSCSTASTSWDWQKKGLGVAAEIYQNLQFVDAGDEVTKRKQVSVATVKQIQDTAVPGKDADVGRFLSSKNWGPTSATPLYSSDIQAQPERLCSPVSINPLSRKVRGLVLPCLGGGFLPISTPGIQWCGSQDLNLRNGQDRILGLLNFLYLQANTGAVAEVAGG
jgi:hypothetical protein